MPGKSTALVSGRLVLRAPRVLSAGSHSRASKAPVAAIGMFTRKIDCQPNASMSTPPTVGPMTAITRLAIERLESNAGGVSLCSRADWSDIADIAAG